MTVGVVSDTGLQTQLSCGGIGVRFPSRAAIITKKSCCKLVDLNKIVDFFKGSAIPQNILNRGQLVLNEFLKPLKILLEQKAIPKKSWSDEQIEFFLQILSQMDTDKDLEAARVGEREARISSKIRPSFSKALSILNHHNIV